MTPVGLTAKVLIIDCLIAVVYIAGVLNAKVLMAECYNLGDLCGHSLGGSLVCL